MIDKLLAHPWQFLIVALGIGVILYSMGKFVPHPLKFLLDLVRIFVKEFDPRHDGLPVERINALIMCAFLVLCLLALFLENSPSAVRQALGVDDGSGISGLTILCLLLFVLSAVLSPAWIWHVRREGEAVRRARELLEFLAGR